MWLPQEDRRVDLARIHPQRPKSRDAEDALDAPLQGVDLGGIDQGLAVQQELVLEALAAWRGRYSRAGCASTSENSVSPFQTLATMPAWCGSTKRNNASMFRAEVACCSMVRWLRSDWRT